MGRGPKSGASISAAVAIECAGQHDVLVVEQEPGGEGLPIVTERGTQLE